MSIRAAGDDGGLASSAAFPTTHWSVVWASADGSSPEAVAALDAICRQYWYRLYAFVRRQGSPPEDAEDLVQSFLAQMLERGAFGQADPARLGGTF